MKKSFLLIWPVLVGSIIALQGTSNSKPNGQVQRPALTDVIGCAPGTAEVNANASGKFITLLPGWGNHKYKINSTDSAQVYFNQGLSMYYSYHSREAVASFKEAARFDSSCAMIYWAQALAMGPSYNFGHLYKPNEKLAAVLAKMNRYVATASAKEKHLVQAMNTRYNTGDTADKERKKLNEDYAAALRPLVAKYPGDLDMKALYTDAVMLLHPWDFWNNDGTAKAWTMELVRHCQDILKKNPHHPAALHYYIHVTEASRQPELALASADSLIKLFPGVAHMVHMSSHEYERIGYYAKGVDANEKADIDMYVYDSLAKGLYPLIHVPHYLSVDAYCALSGAMYSKAMPKSIAARRSVEPSAEKTYAQYQHMFPLFTMVRMGKWEEIINDTTYINPRWSYAGLINDFAKGMAYAKTGAHAEAEKALLQLQQKQKDDLLKEKFSPYTSSPHECAIVAEYILSATIAFEKKNYDAANLLINKAIAAEDKLIYSEPKVWMLPARQYAGSFMLKMNNYTEAEKIYRQDLVWNPGNGWSLLGLYQALQKQHKTGQLKKLKAQYLNSFSHADKMPTGSVY